MRPESPVIAAKTRIGPLRDLLERHGLDARPHRLLCPNPGHADRRPGSVSLYRARDGDERLRCHACGLDEDVIGLARLLGEDVALERRRSYRAPAPRRRPDPLRRALAAYLVGHPAFDVEWGAICLLAGLPTRDAVAAELYRNRAWLVGAGADFRTIWAGIEALRSYAVEHLGLPGAWDRATRTEWIARALGRLEEET